MGRAKPRMYEIPSLEQTPQESKKERKARERREKKFRDALFSATVGQLQYRQENTPRHTRFDDARRKGSRSDQERRAIRDNER